jgi:hypothetical protein
MQKRTPAVTGCGKTSDIAVLGSFRQSKSRQSVNATLHDKLDFNFIREIASMTRQDSFGRPSQAPERSISNRLWGNVLEVADDAWVLGGGACRGDKTGGREPPDLSCRTGRRHGDFDVTNAHANALPELMEEVVAFIECRTAELNDDEAAPRPTESVAPALRYRSPCPH